ncbi:DNA polymerase III subunit delta [Patescibacteria group bacterium]|nr:DNA polymerase III subunit delta [Patescibacteria group bacterium]
MIIFLYGEDTYRMKEKLKEIIERHKKIHKSGLNLKYFDDFTNLKDGIRQTSMFKEKKLAVVTNVFANPDFKEEFFQNKKEFLDSEDIILIYEEKDFNKNNSLFKFLKKNTKSQEFKFLTGQGLKAWIKKEFDKYETKIDSLVLERLIKYIGNDLWQMSNEIKKLASFRNKETLKAEDIELLVKSKIETDIFKTIDAIADKNKKQALNLLHKHLEKGDSPLYLLSMINYQFRNLLIVKDLIEKHKPYNIILKRSGLHPFVVKKSYYQSQKFTFQELKKIFQKIFKVDLDIKTGRIQPEIALDLLIAEI